MASKTIKKIRELLRLTDDLKALTDKVNDLDVRLQQFENLVRACLPLPPIPPKHLQRRVAGGYNPGFVLQGERMCRDIETLLQKHGLGLADFNQILDFGCGCGRTLMAISRLVEPGKISGTDIDAEAITWLKQNYATFHDLAVNDTMPPTKYPDGTFDFIYSISIFTHLPEDMQHAWLRELARLLKPGGHAYLTTHGEKQRKFLSEAACEELMKKGFYYHQGIPTDGLPDFYRTSFHTHDYIHREWSRYFEVLEVVTRGLGDHQDAVLVRKRA